MDTLEETPIADISATYLTDEQFNNLYPKHPIDVSNYLLIMYLRWCWCVTLYISLTLNFDICIFQEQMDTEPYISTVDDLDKFLEEMDTEVTEPVSREKSSKVCHLYVQNF